MAGMQIHYPASLIPTEHSGQTIVTDVLIKRGTNLGPFPGEDASEKQFSTWMQNVTTVTDYNDANLIVAFVENQLYFHCKRSILAGTELIVWGGQIKIHFQEPSKWPKLNVKCMIFMCQDCNILFNSVKALKMHCNNTHNRISIPIRDCKCPYCPQVIRYKTNFYYHIIRYHGINLNIDLEVENTEKREANDDFHLTKNNNASKETPADKNDISSDKYDTLDKQFVE